VIHLLQERAPALVGGATGIAPQAAVSRAALVVNEDVERDGQLPSGARHAHREIFVRALAPPEVVSKPADAHHDLRAA